MRLRSFAAAKAAIHLSIAIAACSASLHAQPPDGEDWSGQVFEGYPARILTSLAAQRQRRVVASRSLATPFALIVPLSRRWDPGEEVRVAFLGGSDALRAQIESAALTWTAPGAANLQLSFREPDGSFRSWAASDTAHRAEIRIAFSEEGYWSHVGRDSTNRALEGGGPGQASMSFEGFDETLPRYWRSIVLHEFGHALGFEHELQSPLAQCGFRYYDDPGYVLNLNADGVPIPIGTLRPGLYTYFAGEPNRWDQARVDANLRAIEASSDYYTSASFDNRSIMRYLFPHYLFEAGARSPCWSERGNVELSQLDLDGAREVYPHTAFAGLVSGRQLIRQMLRSPIEDAALRGALQRALRVEPID